MRYATKVQSRLWVGTGHPPSRRHIPLPRFSSHIARWHYTNHGRMAFLPANEKTTQEAAKLARQIKIRSRSDQDHIGARSRSIGPRMRHNTKQQALEGQRAWLCYLAPAIYAVCYHAFQRSETTSRGWRADRIWFKAHKDLKRPFSRIIKSWSDPKLDKPPLPHNKISLQAATAAISTSDHARSPQITPDHGAASEPSKIRGGRSHARIYFHIHLFR